MSLLDGEITISFQALPNPSTSQTQRSGEAPTNDRKEHLRANTCFVGKLTFPVLLESMSGPLLALFVLNLLLVDFDKGGHPKNNTPKPQQFKTVWNAPPINKPARLTIVPD